MGRKGTGKVRKSGVFIWYRYEAYKIEGFVFTSQCSDITVVNIAMRKAVEQFACHRLSEDWMSSVWVGLGDGGIVHEDAQRIGDQEESSTNWSGGKKKIKEGVRKCQGTRKARPNANPCLSHLQNAQGPGTHRPTPLPMRSRQP